MKKAELYQLVDDNGINEDYICSLGHLNFSQDQKQWICATKEYTIIWLQDEEPDINTMPDFIWHYEKGFIDLE